MSKIYGSYVFKDKDIEIDELRTLIESNFGERVAHKHLRQIERGGGPSASATASWFFGKTKRPQNATIEAAGRAIGFRRTWVQMTSAEKAKIKPMPNGHKRPVKKK